MKRSVMVVAATLALLTTAIPLSAQMQEVPSGEFFVMEVAPEQVECVGVAPQLCLKIRLPGDEDFRFYYDAIQYFNFVAGTSYTLLVERIDRQNVPADASSFIYRLVSILRSSPQMVDDSGIPIQQYAPTGVYVTAVVSPQTQVCRDGFSIETDCLEVRINGGDIEYINPGRVVNFAYVPGQTFTLALERRDLTSENVSDVPAYIYQLVQVISVR